MLTGALTSAAVALFKAGVGGAEWLAFGWAGAGWSDAPWVVVLLVPPAGGLIVGAVLHHRRVSEDPGHGVTEVIQAATLDVEEFPHRRVPLKASLAMVSLGTGASLGPEDPAVEIGGGLGEAVARRWGLPHETVRALVAAGAAGGISALLLTPLAGILFSIEVFAVRLRSRAALLVATSSVVAFLGVQLLVPGHPLDVLLGPDRSRLPLVSGLLVCLALGAAAGLVSVAQIHLSYSIRHLFLGWRSPPRWSKPALGGLILASGGLFLPQLLGIGYGTIESAVAGEVRTPILLLALLAGKMLLMAVSFGSGMLGGFFAPAFFIGAMLGTLVGVVAGAVGVGAEPGTLAVVGMAAALAGMVHAPLTAAVALAGLSGAYPLLPFLLAACLTSDRLARHLSRGSLYTYTLATSERRRQQSSGRTEDFGSQPDLG